MEGSIVLRTSEVSVDEAYRHMVQFATVWDNGKTLSDAERCLLARLLGEEQKNGK